MCAEGPKVFSRNDEPAAANVPTPAILQAFLVRNDGPSTLPVGELVLRYFFTYEGVMEQLARCDASRATEPSVCDDVETPLFEVGPTVFVDGYVEVGLGGQGLVEPTATIEIPVAIEATDGGMYTQNDDYSFAPNAEFAQNRNVTLYRRGVLIWGDEPAGVSITTTTTR
jgi:mannan endo-1,4-beta-mannosidase